MLMLRPNTVTFGGQEWERVERVSIDSSSSDMAESWGNEGPELVFADAVRRRSTARVVQLLDGDDLGDPELGEMSTLRIETLRGGDSGSKVVSFVGVVASVSYSFVGDRSRREIRLVGVSSNGTSSPLRVSEGGS